MANNKQEAVELMSAKVEAAKALMLECKELSREWDVPYSFDFSSNVDDDSEWEDWNSSFESSWESSANC